MSFDSAKAGKSAQEIDAGRQSDDSLNRPSLLDIVKVGSTDAPRPILMADATSAQVRTDVVPVPSVDLRVFIPALRGEVTPVERMERYSPGNLYESTASRNQDNSIVYTDATGRPRGIAYTDGSFSGMEYDRQGNLSRVFRADKEGRITLNEIRRNDGLWSSFKDGKSQGVFDGTYSVRPNGCVEFLNKDSTVDRWDTHGGKLYMDSRGRPLSMTDRNNLKRDYGYDASGALNEVRQTFARGASQIWRQEQGQWYSYDSSGNATGNRYDGRISVDADGSIRQQDRRTGDTKVARPDGTSLIVRAPVDYRPWDVRQPEALPPGVVGDGRARVNPDTSRVLYEGDGSRPTTVIARDGTYRRYQYDNAGNLVGNVSYDGNNQAVSSLRREAGGWVMRDASGQPVNMPPIADITVANDGAMITRWQDGYSTINKNDGSVVQFDNRNNPIGIQDPTGEKRRVTWDKGNNLVMVEYMATSGADVALRRSSSGWQTYDRNGMPVSEPPVQNVQVDRNGTIVITRASGRTTMYTDGRRVVDRGGIPAIDPRALIPQRFR
ncbi:MAG: hypothetical protein IPO31_17855 [Candidatus Obscuribacter sp.]|nr:hypothetical protein [Candidatus Obscuribacter sp.]